MNENVNEIETITKRRNSKSKISMWIIVALSALLLLSIILGVSGAYFQGNDTTTGTVTTGGPVNIDITQGGASAATLTFSDTAMPGDVFDQAISVSAPTGTSKAVLRGKITLVNTDGLSAPVEVTTSADWVEGTDNYYYFEGTIDAGETVDFITAITVPTSLTNEDANKTNTLTVLVEAIQYANGAASIVWDTAPSDWATNYGSGD